MHNQTKFEFRDYMLYIFMFISLLQCRRDYFKFTILLHQRLLFIKNSLSNITSWHTIYKFRPHTFVFY